MYLGYKDEKIKFYTEQPLDTTLYGIDRIEETDKEYVLDGEEYVLKDEAWEEKEAQKEKERIAMLSLTRGDVFRGLLMAKGVTRLMLRGMIETNEQLTEVQREMALIDFDEALNFYRGNALIDTVGLALGIESKQLDKFFDETKKGDMEAYKYLTTVTLTINPTPSDATVTINSEAKNTVTVPYGANVEYSVAAEGYQSQSGSVELTEDTTLDIELVEEGVNEGGIEVPPIEEETAEEENVNNEVEDENTTV